MTLRQRRAGAASVITLVLLPALGLAAAPLFAQSSQLPASSSFARVTESDDGKPRALQVAIVSYVSSDNDSDVTIDLIGAVHVGDRRYYAGLNEQFRRYDAVLYEMIAPPGASIPKPGESRRSMLSNAQIAMRTALELSFQLDEIDYGAANFIHADLSPDGLSAHMQARNESLYVYLWRMFYASVREASRDPLGLRDLELLSSLLAPANYDTLKTALAYELADIESVSTVLEGQSGSALIAARNQHAVDVLKAELDAGARYMGIFYGVAHMPDFERRLADQFNMAPSATRWVDAWRLQDEASGSLR